MNECEHLHIEHIGWQFGGPVVECLDCGATGTIEWGEDGD
jgi:hypothetical protein